MGMFDNYPVFSEHFKEDDPFLLVDAREGGTLATEYGDAVRTLLCIRTKGEGDKWFSIFGMAIASQVTQMERGDLPQRVTLGRVRTKDGRKGYKKLIPVDPETGTAPKGQPSPDETPF